MPYIRHMSTATKNDRLELRLTTEQKREIERAAIVSGRSVTEFSVPLLVDQAQEVLRQERELNMSMEAWEEFNAILDEPAKPLAGLAALLTRPSVFVD